MTFLARSSANKVKRPSTFEVLIKANFQVVTNSRLTHFDSSAEHPRPRPVTEESQLVFETKVPGTGCAHRHPA